MKRFCFFILVILVIISGAPESPAENPTTPPQPVATAERTLHILGDPASCDTILQQFHAIQTGEGNGVGYAHGVMHSVGLEDDMLTVAINIPARTVDLKIAFQQPPATDPEQAVLDLARAFAQQLTRSSQSREASIKQDTQQLADTQTHISELKDRREQLETELRQSTGAVDVSPDSVRQRLASMQTQKESAIIELAAKQARSDALSEQISKFSGQIQEKIKADPIASELAKVVEARQKEFDQIQSANKAGGASPTEVNHAMAALAEANAKLLERQEVAANAAGGDIVAGWNRELMTLSVDLAELRARSKALDERLAAYAHADDYVNNADQWLSEITALQKQSNELNGKISDEKSDYDRHHVEISISKDSTGPTTQPAK